jgi:hypothetical protein
MNENEELLPDDPLYSLLSTYQVEGSTIENRVLLQLQREEEQDALRVEIAELRAEVSTLRAEMGELKRLLLTRREPIQTTVVSLMTDTTRGKPLLPYVRHDDFSLLPGQTDPRG